MLKEHPHPFPQRRPYLENPLQYLEHHAGDCVPWIITPIFLRNYQPPPPVLRLQRDAWLIVKRLKQATNEYPPPPPPLRLALCSKLVSMKYTIFSWTFTNPTGSTIIYFLRQIFLISQSYRKQDLLLDLPSRTFTGTPRRVRRDLTYRTPKARA